MSTFKDIEPFIGKKDLSKTARENIVKIFCQLDSDVKIEDIVAKLLVFPQEVIGNYILQAIEKKSVKEKDEFIASLIKKIEPVKFGHLFRAYHAFRAISDEKRAFDLLFSKMETELVKKDINKQIFQGLDKMIKECSFVAFLVIFDESQKRNLNVFAAFLLKYFDYNKSGALLTDIIKFYEMNRLVFPKELTVADVATETPEKSKKPAAAKPLTFEEHLELAVKMYAEIKEAKASQDDELKNIKAEIVVRNSEVVDLKGKLSMLQNQHDCLKEAYERTQAELMRVQTAKVELERQKVDLESRLGNLASGYGAAGHQEIESLKGTLKARLKVSFDKFAEIKNEQPDMDYYNILILILDEIQKTLKKNGIEV